MACDSFPSNLIEEMSANKLSFAAYSIKRVALEKIGYFDERVILDSDWLLGVRFHV